MKSRILPLILSSVWFSHPGHGQNREDTARISSDSTTRVNVIAIGVPPEPRMSIQGEFRVLLDVPESEYPPQQLFVPMHGAAPHGIFLGINAPSEQFDYRGSSKLRLQVRSEVGGGDFVYKDYAEVELPSPGKDSTILIMRSRPKASWRDKPRCLVFMNDADRFPIGNARIINFSSKPLLFKIGDNDPFGIPPSKMRMVPVMGDHFIYSIASQGSGEAQIIADHRATPFHGTDRINLIVYDHDSNETNANTATVKFNTYFEFPPSDAGNEQSPEVAE